ncbi:hypothetical protein GKQ77_01585 [Streptomyces sp. BG9H]|uniref:Uncharacterized protein n=1 Tax=Streptomyces anatolicus TaxID=2675858 RepID=A0ABS6YFT4_9ACTN|nr:hypothetical protein [Streptomyces anatolicus]MBW5420262.1 hypothetical protein [Streptomyces anatolicus]
MALHPLPQDLGQRAYAAYGEVTGGLTHDGRTMPPWEDLGEDIQAAWTVAASSLYQAGADAASQAGGR